MQNKYTSYRSSHGAILRRMAAVFVVCAVAAIAVGGSMRASTGDQIVSTGSVIVSGSGWTATGAAVSDERLANSSDASFASPQQHRSVGAASSAISSEGSSSSTAPGDGCCSVDGSSSLLQTNNEQSITSNDSSSSTNPNTNPPTAVLLETGSVAHPANLNPHFFIAKNPLIADASSLSAALHVDVADASGTTLPVTPIVDTTDGGYMVTLTAPDQITPGTYHVSLTLNQGNSILQILHVATGPVTLFDGTVTLGGIVWDSDKDSYGLNQIGHFSFSILDDSGNPRCDMKVTVFAKDPIGELQTFTTESGGIVTSHCDAQSALPDYSFDLPLVMSGDYLVHLEASDGTTVRSFRTSIAVSDHASLLQVRRSMTSRMAANGSAQVTLTLFPQQTFIGSVTDVIPAGFDVQVLDTTAVIGRKGNGHTVTWNKLWQKDTAYTLSYSVIGKSLPEHPLVSLLGPLTAQGTVQDAAMSDERSAGSDSSSVSSEGRDQTSEISSADASNVSESISSLIGTSSAASDASFASPQQHRSAGAASMSSEDVSSMPQASSDDSSASSDQFEQHRSDGAASMSSDDLTTSVASSSAASTEECCSVDGSSSSIPNPNPISSFFSHVLGSLFADLTPSASDFSFTEAHRWQLLTTPLVNIVPNEHTGPVALQLTPTKDHFQASDAPTFLLVNSIVEGTGSALYTQNGDLKPSVALAEVAKATTDNSTIAKEVVKAIISGASSDIAQSVIHDSTDVTALRDALGTQAGSVKRTDVLQTAVTDALANTHATDALANVAVQDPAVNDAVGTLLQNDSAKEQIIQAAVDSRMSATGGTLTQTVSLLLNQASPDLQATASTAVLNALTQSPATSTALAQSVTASSPALNPSPEGRGATGSILPSPAGGRAGDGGLFKVTLKSKDGKTITPNYHFEKGSVLLVLDPERSFTPGLYMLEVESTDPLTGTTQTLTQDFAWGVLAMNPNKDRYMAGDKAEIDIGVLDNSGDIVCNADLSLTVTKPDGTTQQLSSGDQSIETTGTCGLKQAGFIGPDFRTFLTLDQSGTYDLGLTAATKNGTRSISSTITVDDTAPYVISRTAATRLWPFAPSPMDIAVSFNEDFSGDVTDQVPDGFTVSGVSDSGIVHTQTTLSDASTGSTITWHGSWKKGDTATLHYDYDAPDISPQYYLIGPLMLANSDQRSAASTNENSSNATGYSLTANSAELRSWQIANDAGGTVDTWTGGGADTKWSTSGNWSGGVPTKSNIAYFGSTNTKNATVDTSFAGNISELKIAPGYTGTISLGRNLNVNGQIILSGGTLISNGKTIRGSGSWINFGTNHFTAGTGTVILTGTGTTQTLSGSTFNNLTINDGLVGYWKLDDGTGSTVLRDASGNGNNGTLSNGPTWSSNVPSRTQFYNPKSLHFDGSNDFATLPNVYTSVFTNLTYTISMWIYPQSLANNPVIFDTTGNPNATTSDTYIELTSLGKIDWISQNNGRVYASGLVGTGSWYHLAFVKTGTGNLGVLYVNGVQQNTFTGHFNNANPVGTSITLGKYNAIAGEEYRGLIDDVRLYNRAMSGSEVRALYNGNQNTGSGMYSLGSALTVNGNLNIVSGGIDVSSSNFAVTVGGNWSDVGAFTARSGTVTFTGTNQTMTGTTVFNNFTKTVSSAAKLFLDFTGRQSFSGALTMNGVAGNLLSVRSTQSGSGAHLLLDGSSGTQSLSYLDVKDSNASGGAALACYTDASGCVDSGNNTQWNFVPPTIVWTGGGSDNNWSTAANWSGGVIPTSVNSVLFDGRGKKNATIDSSFAGTVNNLTISKSYTGSITLSHALTVNGTLTDSGTNTTGLTWTAGAQNNLHVVGDMLVNSGATVTVAYSSLTGNGSGQNIIVDGNLTVATGATISADRQGFPSGQGPAHGTSSNGVGGTYGGVGTSNTNATYGSISNPTALGSGGFHPCSAGGGAIIFSIAGIMTVNGTVSANGTATCAVAPGAGGSINVTATALTGHGTIRTNAVYASNGGGGGGRISLANVTTNTFTGNLQANGSLGDEAGTIYLDGSHRSTLTLGGTGNMSSLTLGSDGTNDYTFGAIVINAGGTLSVSGNPNMNSPYGGATTIHTASLLVKSSGTITADGFGFVGGQGPGIVASGDPNGAGGAYGGLGQNNTATTYGSITSPTSLGSGGGNATCSVGGGAIIVVATGAVVINGTISANGKATCTVSSGAGGSVNVTAGTFSGTGTIKADSVSSGIGGGGGGRVAVVLTSGTSFGSVTIHAYGESAGEKGAAGTVYEKTASQSVGDLIIDNNSAAATPTTQISSRTTGTTVGNVTMQNAGLLTLGTGVTLNVAGDWTANATTNVGSGTVVFNGTNQHITGSANTTFYNLTKTVSAADTLTFNHLRTTTILNNTTLQGVANNRLSLRSDSTGSQFAANVSNAGTRTIQYVDVKDSDNTNATSILCATGCVNSGNNTNWTFPWAGTLYLDDGITPAGAGHTVAVSVNGAAAAATTTTDASGAYSVIASSSSGDVITLYIPSGDSIEAAVVTKAGQGGGTVDLYKDHLITRSENGSPLTDANLATADNNGNAGITDFYTVTGNDLTVLSSKTLRVWTGSILQPGGSVALKNIEIRGTLAAGTNNINVDGSWDGSGGTLTGNSTVTVDAVSAQTITSRSSFYNLVINGTGGTFALQNGLTVTHALDLTAGTLNLNGHGLTVTGATYTNHGTLALHGDETLTGFTNVTTSGETRFTGSGTYSSFDGLTSFHDLTMSGAGITILHAAVTTAGNLTITRGTLRQNGQSVSVGGSWNDHGTYTGTGTVTFTGSGTVREPARFQNITINSASQTVRLVSPLAVSGSMTIHAGTLSAGTGQTISIDGIWENETGTFSAGSGTVRLTGNDQTLSGSTTFWNLQKNITTLATLTFTAGSTQTVHGTWTAHGVTGQSLHLRSSTTGTQWKINPTQYDLAFIDVKDSNNVSGTTILAANDAVNSGNNTDWAFPIAVTVTDASGATVGSGVTVSLAVGSGVVVTSTTNSSGVATFNDGISTHTVSGISSGALLTMYLPNSATGAVTVDHTNGTSLSFTLKENTLTVSNHGTAPITNQDLITASEISSGTGVSSLFTMSGTALTDSGNILIPTGSIYTPGGDVTANNYRIAGTFHMEGNTVTVNGSWDATGGSFDGSNTVNFASTSAQTITVNTSSFFNVVFVVGSSGTNTSGSWTTVGNLRVLGTQTIENSTRTTPPVITNVSASPIYDKTVLITWNTDESADTEVQYGTASGSLSLSYTGSALDLSHTATLQDLTPGTTYYYRVESEDLAGNIATGSVLSFTTLDRLSTAEELAQAEAVAKAEGVTLGRNGALSEGGGGGGGGGGSSTYCAPTRGPNSFLISGLSVAPSDNGTASVSFATNGLAVGIVNYGVQSTDESAASDLTFGTDHTILLKALQGHTVYHLQANAVDQCGNIVQSDAITFTSGEGGSGGTVGAATASGAQALASLLQKLSGVVSLSDLKAGLTQAQQVISNLVHNVPGPLLGGEPKVTVTDTTATVSWTTDESADSMVFVSPDSVYDGKTYAYSSGNDTEQVTDHTVRLSGLNAGTRYHYKVQSKTSYGTQSESKDFTFVTNQQQIQILNYKVDIASPTSATFTWITNIPTTTKVIYTPYKNDVLTTDAAQSVKSDAFSTSHTITIKDFEGGIIYDIELTGSDPSGITVSKILSRFATSAQGFAPAITQVQTDSAIIPGKDSRIQAVISWNTSTLTTGRVYYQQGVSSDPAKPLALSTPLDSNYTKKHVVLLSNLDPGAIYSFQVESTDLAGNLSRTKTYTILTPRQEEGIIQVILKQMQDTFGWLNNLKQ